MKKILLFFILFLLVACQQQEEQNLGLYEENEPIQLSTEASNLSIAKKVKNLLSNREEVNDLQVIVSGKEILAAMDIKQRYRFQLEDLQGAIRRQLKDKYPTYTPLVSTDLKIFLEAQQINESITKQSISDELLFHEFERIKILMKEQT